MSGTVALIAALLAGPAPSGEPAGPADTEDVGVVTTKEADPTVFPDPRKFSRGFFGEAGVGPLIPIGPTADVLHTGFSVAGRMGYEIRRWIALQVHATGSVSKYDDGVLTDELLQQYFYTGELRFGIPIRRFLIALQGGAGLYQLSSNLLQVAGVADSSRRYGFAYDGSVALDFHSLAKHFSGGVVATYVGVPDLGHAGSLGIQVYLRYTL